MSVEKRQYNHEFMTQNTNKGWGLLALLEVFTSACLCSHSNRDGVF